MPPVQVKQQLQLQLQFLAQQPLSNPQGSPRLMGEETTTTTMTLDDGQNASLQAIQKLGLRKGVGNRVTKQDLIRWQLRGPLLTGIQKGRNPTWALSHELTQGVRGQGVWGRRGPPSKGLKQGGVLLTGDLLALTLKNHMPLVSNTSVTHAAYTLVAGLPGPPTSSNVIVVGTKPEGR
jgi:hypothetical protein